MEARPGSLTASVLACGMAMPSPIPVLPSASRARTRCLYSSLSFRLPPAAMRSTRWSMAAALSATEAFRSMLCFLSKSTIRICFSPSLCDFSLYKNALLKRFYNCAYTSLILSSVASHSWKAEALPALMPILRASSRLPLEASKPARKPATMLSPAPTELTSVPFGD